MSALNELRPGLVVDAILGYGLQGAPRGRTRELIEWAVASPAPVLSLDIPSGVDPDSGANAGVVVRPHATLTLALPKTGLVVAETGELWLADLGIPSEVCRRIGLQYESPFGDRFLVPLRR